MKIRGHFVLGYPSRDICAEIVSADETMPNLPTLHVETCEYCKCEAAYLPPWPTS